MKILFAPAMFLMDRVRYPVKFGIIFTLVLIPLVVLSLNLITTINARVALLKNEQNGLSYIKEVRQPIEHIQQHRGMTAAYLNGATEFRQRILSKREIVDKKLAQLKKIDGTLGAQFGTNGDIDNLMQQWDDIKANTMKMKAAEAIKKHSAMIADMLTLIAKVADASEITLDPALDSYYIGSTLVSGLPNMLENMGQARAVGSGVAAKGSFANQKVYIKLAVLSNSINNYFKTVQSDLQSVYGENPGISKYLKGPTESNNNAIREMQSLLNDKLLHAETITVSGDTVFNAATKAISGSYKLYDALVPELDMLFTQRIQASQTTLIVTISAIVATLVLLAYLFTGFYFAVRHSIAQISDVTDKLADGDLTVRVNLSARDEMSMIAQRFNSMAEKFNALIQQIISASTQLATASEEVSSVATESASNVEQQRHETDQVATAINEMTATVLEVASNATSAAGAATNADNEAKGGKSVVESTSRVISQLASEIENAANVIKELEQNSETIGGVLDVIKGIAEQTNLLALNAAIEAARAGEQGRGFAVVADEVRTLASRTQESASEIETMIEKLQSGSHNAVEVMEKSREQAQAGVEQANEAGESLEAITRAVATINEMNTQIASAAEEQSAVAEEINKNITSISQISEQTANGSEQTTSSANELARLASALQDLVGQFKISA
jgi:methyl-accepting chemotaxis protein